MKFSKILPCLSAFLFLFSSALTGQQFDGFALYNPQNNQTTYLIDKEGDIANTWSNNVNCNYSVLLMESGNLMRGGVKNGNAINGAAVGGLVQEIDPNSNVVWEFEYSTSEHVSHHDITLMPNGGVLLTAWEVKNSAELSAAGYTGNSTVRYPTHFVEVQQDGTGGKIVWEWHLWNHMVQDVDPNKPNYGVIAEHPELMDINVTVSGGGGPGGGGGGDWFHINGVNYNEELDQIVFSSRFLSEIFIIDHSTTTAEAAGHTGGNAGKGGDFLYRWGKPSNYDTPGTQTIAGAVHDARWITNDGRPNGGYVQFFNNVGGTNGNSAVDAIKTPLSADGYNYDRTAAEAYGPETYTWRHNCIDNANGQSASNRMPNGNTFVNLSMLYMYEVDSLDNLVWQYSNGSAKAFRYTCDYPGTIALLNDPCGVVNDVEEAQANNIKLFPNPSTGILNMEGFTLEDKLKNIIVYDIYGSAVKAEINNSKIDLSAQPVGVYFVKMQLNDSQVLTKKVFILN